MPRPPANPSIRRAMCNRLSRLLKTAYDDNWSQLAERLGYANPSGILSVKRGSAFPDVQRLQKLSNWTIEGGFSPSLDWIVLNKGPAVIRYGERNAVEGLSLSELAARRAKSRRI